MQAMDNGIVSGCPDGCNLQGFKDDLYNNDFVNMPSLVIFVVKVETAFYEKYTLYVSALNNGTYDLIRKERDVMSRELRQQLFLCMRFSLSLLLYWSAWSAYFSPI